MARGAQITRKTQLAKREAVKKQLRKVFEAVSAGYQDQAERADDNIDYWDLYLCKRSPKQSFNGNADLYVPLVQNAINARQTRFLNQIFPENGRYIEVTTANDEDSPHAEMALLELYVKRAELRTKVMPALLIAGDIEGQHTICVTWGSRTRHIVSRETHPIRLNGIDLKALEGVETLQEETVEDAGPEVDVVSDSDLLILPATAETVGAALECGGSVTTLCRWTKTRIEELVKDGDLDSDLTAALLVEMDGSDDGAVPNMAKNLADAAGIKAGGKFCLVYRTWTKIEINGESRLVLAYFSGDDDILGCKLCPYWCDRPDIISVPVRKLPGTAKGMSLAKPCADMQYLANDFINMAADSGVFTLNPVILTDPLKNPRVDSMVLDSMAIWQTSPRDTQALQFPAVYPHAFNVVQAAERYINASLGVNAAMLPQSTGVPGRKRNQAEIAMEQQVDLLMTSVEVSNIENGILTPMVERFAEYDAQFRDIDITVRSVGELGVKAEMQTVKPLQMGRRYQYRWFGVEAGRTVQQVQQQISALNVIKEMSQDPSVAAEGYQLRSVPLIRTVAENAFGPRLAPEIFSNQKAKLSLDPQLENGMLAERMEVKVSPLDEDPKHMQAHMQLMQNPDIGVKAAVANHLAAHQRQMRMKQQAAVMQQMQQSQQQARPGGGRAAQGTRPGGQVGPPRQVRAPPGAVHPDQMRGGLVQMPRRM